MEELGLITALPIRRFTDFGAYLGLHSGEEVLLPQGYLTGNEVEGDMVEVFVYTDSEDRPVAVTEHPKVLLDEFAVLEVKETTSFGAFLDWGLPKDLFVPISEMGKPMEVGQKHLIRVCVDHKTTRLIGVSKYAGFIDPAPVEFMTGLPLTGLIFDRTDLGYKVLVESQFEGLLYANEVFEPLEIGEKRTVYLKKRREDGKLDLQLLPTGREKYEEGAQKILDVLATESVLKLHDKSSPDEIKKKLGMSKKHFKQSIGQLYKARKIVLLPGGIALNSSN